MSHWNKTYFDDEPDNPCACMDGPIQCNVEGCDEWADICQGMNTCWDHYEEDKKE